MESVLYSSLIENVRLRLSGIDKERIEKACLVPAAVMLLLFEKDGQSHILFNKRSQEVEHHKGEIAFPGGVYDEVDGDLKATALRETWEEMGIRREHVEVLGELNDMETRTNFRIVPFVGTFSYPYPFQANPSEVTEVIEVPIGHLLTPSNHWQEVQEWLGYPRTEHYYQYQDHVVFGATARILHQFLGLIG